MRRDLAHSAKLILLKCPLDFGVCAHYKRTSTNDWLVERFSVHNKKLGIGLGPYCDMIASAGEDCEVAFGYISTVVDANLATQYEKDARVPIGQWKFRGFSSAEIYIPQIDRCERLCGPFAFAKFPCDDAHSSGILRQCDDWNLFLEQVLIARLGILVLCAQVHPKLHHLEDAAFAREFF